MAAPEPCGWCGKRGHGKGECAVLLRAKLDQLQLDFRVCVAMLDATFRRNEKLEAEIERLKKEGLAPLADGPRAVPVADGFVSGVGSGPSAVGSTLAECMDNPTACLLPVDYPQPHM